MTLRTDVFSLIEEHAMNRPRSLQKAPGVSDLSGSCDHCVAAKIAGWPKASDAAWLAYIGTAVHAQVEQAFSASEWRTELPVTIGRVGSWHVEGSADLVHLPTRTVIDFKTAGKTVLDAARKGNIPDHYRRQVNLYAWGLTARHVVLCFLPRNEPRLESAVWWEQPVDLIDAERTLQRARQLAAGVDRYGDDWITDLPRDPKCYDCARYPDAPVAELVAPGTVLGGIMR
jgi:hypothetical protein